MTLRKRLTDWTDETVEIIPPPGSTVVFPFGQLTATPRALEALRRNPSVSVWTYLSRHITGDWGDVDREDSAANDRAVQEGTRLLSSYTLPDDTRIWIITEADRSVTTLLLPDDY